MAINKNSRHHPRQLHHFGTKCSSRAQGHFLRIYTHAERGYKRCHKTDRKLHILERHSKQMEGGLTHPIIESNNVRTSFKSSRSLSFKISANISRKSRENISHTKRQKQQKRQKLPVPKQNTTEGECSTITATYKAGKQFNKTQCALLLLIRNYHNHNIISPSLPPFSFPSLDYKIPSPTSPPHPLFSLPE